MINYQNDLERLKKELSDFCHKYRHLLPDEWLELEQQIQNDSNRNSLRQFFVNIFSWWNGLEQGIFIVKALIYIIEWQEICSIREKIQELIQAGNSYLDFYKLQEMLAMLQEGTNRVEHLIHHFRYRSQVGNENKTALFQEIQRELNEATKLYKNVMSLIGKFY